MRVLVLKERKEWPPSKSDDIPTASPLYIDPSSRGPTPHLIVTGHSDSTPPQIESNPGIFVPKENPTYYNPPANPAPPQTITIPATPQQIANLNPGYHLIETKYTKTPKMEEYGEDSKSYEMSSISQNALAHKMSICSAEVTNITGRRSAKECVETISDTIDTHILVNAITKERPKSPPPVHRKDSVLDTQDISVTIAPDSSDKSGNPVIPVVKVNDTTTTAVIIETGRILSVVILKLVEVIQHVH